MQVVDHLIFACFSMLGKLNDRDIQKHQRYIIIMNTQENKVVKRKGKMGCSWDGSAA